MLPKLVEEALIKQINNEAYSSTLYLSMASWAEVSGFIGVADWMYAQAEEERTHMLKFAKYVNERGGKTTYSKIENPPSEFDNVKKLFEEVLKHEELISQEINNILGVCIEEKDYATQSWLQWFVNEQMEEEASVKTILDKLNMIDENNLYLFDRDILSLRNKDNSNTAT